MCFEIGKVVKRCGDSFSDFFSWFVIGVWCQVVLVESMVLDLSCVVEYVIFRVVNNFF